MARRPNIGSAGSDLVFALMALIVGWAGFAPIYAFLVFGGALVAWAMSRRRPLMKLPLASRLTQGAIAVVMIAAVLALAYWIGTLLGGHS